MTAVASKSVLDPLRTGDFLDGARVRRVAAVYCCVAIASLAALLLTSDGFKDRLGRPLGTDFMALYVAGSVAREEGGGAAYDAQAQYKEHQDLLGVEEPAFWPYLYPPAFVFIAAALAALPYLPAWLLWMATTLALYVAATGKFIPGGFSALLALAFPAAYSTFIHGQNGFLVAALFGFGLHSLFRRRMIVAGVLFGLIAIKPQYGLLIPVALAASGHWRAFTAAAMTVVALAALPAIAFGPEIWTGFFETMRLARIEIVEAGAIGFEKIASVFAQARMIGAPVSLAWTLQGAVAVGLAVLVFLLWRSGASDALKGASLVIASVLATPYAVDYDFVILAPAIALLIREALARGFLPYEKSSYLLVAAAPLVGRPIGAAAHVSIGLLALLALLAIIVQRKRRGAASNPRQTEA